jgi:thioredoxin reductase (NADPH)
MRRLRLNRDLGLCGPPHPGAHDSRDGHQLDDFLDKNHIPHRLVDLQSEQGVALAARFICRRAICRR